MAAETANPSGQSYFGDVPDCVGARFAARSEYVQAGIRRFTRRPEDLGSFLSHICLEHTVNHMGLEPPIRKNISFAYYESGHMVYIDQKADDKLHRDVDSFITGSHNHGGAEPVTPEGRQ